MLNMFKHTETQAGAQEMHYWELVHGTMVLDDRRKVFGLELELPPASNLDHFMEGEMLAGICAAIRSTETNCMTTFYRFDLRETPNCIEPYIKSLPASATTNIQALHMARANNLKRLQRNGQLRRVRYFATFDMFAPELGIENPTLFNTLAAGVFKGMRRRTHMSFSRQEFSERLQKVEMMRTQIRNILSSAGIAAHEMSNAESLDFIRWYLNPNLADTKTDSYTPKWQSDGPTLRERVQTEFDNSKRETTNVAGKHLGIIRTIYQPSELSSGNSNLLMANCDNVYTVQIKHLALVETVEKVEGMREFARGQIEGGSNKTNLRSVERETTAFLDEQSRSGSHPCEVNAQVVIYADSKEELEAEKARLIGQASKIAGMPYRGLSQGLMTPFLEGAPFMGQQFTGAYPMTDVQATMFLPLTAPWIGNPGGSISYVTSWGTPAYINLYSRETSNYNGAIIGIQGRGKSVEVNKLISETARYSDFRNLVVDLGGSYHSLFELLEADGVGVRVILDEKSDTHYNMFDLPLGQLEASDEKLNTLVNNIELMYKLPENDQNIARLIVKEAVKIAYINESGRDTEGNRVMERPPVLSDVRKVLQNNREIAGGEMTDHMAMLAEDIAIQLADWCGDTANGRMIDGYSNIAIDDKPNIYFDLTAFGKNLALGRVIVAVLCDLIDNLLSSQDKGTQKRVYFDDTDELSKVPAFVTVLNNMALRSRKNNAGVIIATQMWSLLPPAIKMNGSYFWLLGCPQEEDVIASELRLTESAIFDMKNLKRIDGKFTERLHVQRQITKRGEVAMAEVLQVHLTKKEFWAFTSNPEDRALRNLVIKQQDGNVLAALEWLENNVEPGTSSKKLRMELSK